MFANQQFSPAFRLLSYSIPSIDQITGCNVRACDGKTASALAGSLTALWCSQVQLSNGVANCSRAGTDEITIT